MTWTRGLHKKLAFFSLLALFAALLWPDAPEATLQSGATMPVRNGVRLATARPTISGPKGLTQKRLKIWNPAKGKIFVVVNVIPWSQMGSWLICPGYNVSPVMGKGATIPKAIS